MKAKYSFVYVTADATMPEDFLYSLKVMLKQGIKVLLFTPQKPEVEEGNKYEDVGLFHWYNLEPNSVTPVTLPFTAIDGVSSSSSRKMEEMIKFLGTNCVLFNAEQYYVEHAQIDQHLCVEAGAGTGKTKVMVDRVLFLLHMVEGLQLQDIFMITFTRDSTAEMRTRLRTVLHERFRATKQMRYLKWLEQLGTMPIQTIHSFSKRLLRQVGSVLGYGQSVSISNFRLERRNIIQEYLNNNIEKWFQGQRIADCLKMPLYEFVELADHFWERFENQGLTMKEIENVEWGNPTAGSESLHSLLTELFDHCEKELQALKKSRNTVSTNDLTRLLVEAKFKQADLEKISESIRFLFIDEFQDTDVAQIELIAWLQSKLDTRLFVVGDIKQSIYRFRGAKHTAFVELERKLLKIGTELSRILLIKNYRTSSALLQDMDERFSIWKTRNYLTNDPSLIAANQNGSRLPEHYFVKDGRNRYRTDKQYQQEVVELIRKAQQSLPNIKDNRVVALVRTNYEAELLKHWCETDGFRKLYLATEGTFFKSPAVKEFSILISALLHPNDPVYLYNLSATSYSDVRIDWRQIVLLNGDQNELRDMWMKNEPIKSWKTYLDDLRIKPVLAICRRIIRQTMPAQRMAEKLDDSVAGLQYAKDLDYLIDMLHEQFSDDFISLPLLHRWLTVKCATDRKTSQPLLRSDELEGYVQIMTVHKSKGLEFHTVVLPFVDRSFFRTQSGMVIGKEEGILKVGWLLVQRNEGKVVSSYQNDQYDELMGREGEELLNEETRLLYVAMTRSMDRLWIYLNQPPHTFKDTDISTWAQLLKIGRRVN